MQTKLFKSKVVARLMLKYQTVFTKLIANNRNVIPLLRYVSTMGLSLEGLDLSYANFEHRLLEGFNFSGINLSGARFMDASLQRCNFSGCDLRGTRFFGARLNGATLEGSIINSETCLWGANLMCANVKDCNFSGCDLRCATFAYADTTGANFEDSDKSDVTMGLVFYNSTRF